MKIYDHSNFKGTDFYIVFILLLIALLILLIVPLIFTISLKNLIFLIILIIIFYYCGHVLYKMKNDRTILYEIEDENFKFLNQIFKTYDKSIIITGAVRDVDDTCLNVLSNIDSIRKQFKKSTVILYENDSKDDTVNIITTWAKDKKDVVLLLNQVNNVSNRTKRIGVARQTIIDYIRQDDSLKKYDYLLCIDFGTENSSKKLANTIHYAIDTMIENEKIVGIFPSSLHFYDDWPLKIKDINEIDTHSPIFSTIYMWYINKKMNDIYKNAREENAMIKVESAFGGAALYRLKNVIESGTKYDGTYTCEHTSFNLGLTENDPSSILVIHPKFEIGTWTSSYTSSL